ncbi:unnamed protein product [Discula destructiva]
MNEQCAQAREKQRNREQQENILKAQWSRFHHFEAVNPPPPKRAPVQMLYPGLHSDNPKHKEWATASQKLDNRMAQEMAAKVMGERFSTFLDWEARYGDYQGQPQGMWPHRPAVTQYQQRQSPGFVQQLQGMQPPHAPVTRQPQHSYLDFFQQPQHSPSGFSQQPQHSPSGFPQQPQGTHQHQGVGFRGWPQPPQSSSRPLVAQQQGLQAHQLYALPDQRGQIQQPGGSLGHQPQASPAPQPPTFPAQQPQALPAYELQIDPVQQHIAANAPAPIPAAAVPAPQLESSINVDSTPTFEQPQASTSADTKNELVPGWNSLVASTYKQPALQNQQRQQAESPAAEVPAAEASAYANDKEPFTWDFLFGFAEDLPALDDQQQQPEVPAAEGPAAVDDEWKPWVKFIGGELKTTTIAAAAASKLPPTPPECSIMRPKQQAGPSAAPVAQDTPAAQDNSNNHADGSALSEADQKRRVASAKRMLQDSGIDLDEVPAERFDNFVRLSPEQQAEAVASFIREGVELGDLVNSGDVKHL